MMRVISSFEENGIIGILKRLEEREYEIEVYNKNNPEYRLTEQYSCQYPDLFGLDVYDKQQLERIVDELLSKLNGELTNE